MKLMKNILVLFSFWILAACSDTAVTAPAEESSSSTTKKNTGSFEEDKSSESFSSISLSSSKDIKSSERLSSSVEKFSSSLKISSVASSSSLASSSSSIGISSSISLSSSLTMSSSSVLDDTKIAGWLTEAIFNAIVPNRNNFYTWESFKAAYADLISISTAAYPSIGSDYASFLNEGTELQKKRELAAFFGQIAQETGQGSWNTGLFHITETCAASGSPTGNCLGYKDAGSTWGINNSKYYYGRGPFQLSWNSNYGWFSKAYYGNESKLVSDPDIVQNDPKIAFLAAMWFWTVQEYWTSNPTLHDVMVNGSVYDGRSGFGGTTKAINGVIECSSPGNSNATKRGQYYVAIQENALGLTGAEVDRSNLACK